MLIIRHESANGSNESPLNLNTMPPDTKFLKAHASFGSMIKFNESRYTHFFISITFISNAKLKFAKNQANAKH